MNSQRILFVDDDEVSRELMTMLLRVHGFNVDVAASAASALDAMTENHSVLVTDHDLGNGQLNGLQLAKAFKASRSRRFVILVTGWSNLTIGSEIDHMIVKPTPTVEFVTAVKRGLNG